MNLLGIYIQGAYAILLLMIVLWIISLILQNSSIVDIFWGVGFVITVWIYFVLTPEGFITRKWLITALVTIWGLRLSLFILWRNWGKEEDFRYRAWREDAGPKWWWFSFFKVFLLQGFLMWVISAPLLAAQVNPAPARWIWLDSLGVLIWLLGFIFEAIGDWQLARFKANPENQGKLFTTGVWRYSRHPNYFGDAAQWWGFYLVALAAGGWWTVYSPILMTVLLRNVSGVAMLEKSLIHTKPGYQEYVQSTNAFFPWFPRSSGNDPEKYGSSSELD